MYGHALCCIQGETELSFRLIPSKIQSHTKPLTETVRKEVILAKEGISLKDNSVSPRTIVDLYFFKVQQFSQRIKKMSSLLETG